MAGRPRSPELDDALTRATAELLVEVGYAATTVDAISARAGVPKSTLYRRWSTRAELVFAAVVHGPQITVPDTGALASDLLELAKRIVAALIRPAARVAMPGLLADLAADPQLRNRFDRDVIGRQRELVRTVLERGVARGELASTGDIANVHAQMLGTAYAWIAVVGGSVPRDLPARIAAAAYTVVIEAANKGVH